MLVGERSCRGGTVVESDAELVIRAKRGDVAAFGALVERYERSVLAVALADLRDFHTAEDVAQAAFLSAYRRLASLRDGTRFGPWLLQIVRREVVDAVRSNRRVVATVPCVEGHPVAPALPAHDTGALGDLLALVARLPRRERLLIGLRYFDGKSMSEISQFTGRPVGSVTKQLSCAVARLRAWSAEKYA